MDISIVIGRLVLAAIFLTSGVLKLRQRESTAGATRDFGLPEPLVEPVAAALPFVELAVALALIVTPTAWFGAIASALLLGGFTIAMVTSLAHGRKPACNCFGELSREPIGLSTVARNIVLLAIALYLAILGRGQTDLGLWSWYTSLGHTDRGLLALALLVIAATAFQFWMLRGVRAGAREASLHSSSAGTGEAAETGVHAHAELAGLPAGSVAPEFAATTLDGEPVTLGSLLESGKLLFLLFTEANCTPCNALMPEVGQWQKIYADFVNIVLVAGGSVEANREKAAQHDLDPGRYVVQGTASVQDMYRVQGTPSAVLVQPGRIIGSPLAGGGDAIRMLLSQVLTLTGAPGSQGTQELAAAPQPQQTGLPVGSSAPEIPLTTLEGRKVTLADLCEEDTLVLFWSSTCGFCNAMEPDLLEWEKARSAGDPALVVVVPGAGGGQAVRFRSTVVIDRDGRLADEMSAQGTPMGILLDEHGHVASNVAAGADEVFRLLRHPAAA